jgi:DNA polymerase III epsilon subunit-like protein
VTIVAYETLRRCSGERINCETTDLDGVIVELAIIDAATGQVLLDTLVNPGGVPVADSARAVHGISDEELAAAPGWADVAPAFLAAVDGRRVLAYNADFDRGRVAATHASAGLDTAQLPRVSRWDCLMEAQSDWLRIGRWLRLGGRHRALGDAKAARQVLLRLASPAGAYRAS